MSPLRKDCEGYVPGSMFNFRSELLGERES